MRTSLSLFLLEVVGSFHSAGVGPRSSLAACWHCRASLPSRSDRPAVSARVSQQIVAQLQQMSSKSSSSSMAEATRDAAPVTAAGGHPHTAESRAKISAANKGKVPWNQGKKHSEETRRRIAEGTRRAIERKAELARVERERLRREEPEVWAQLVAEAAAKAVAKAEKMEVLRERKNGAAEKAAAKAERAARRADGTSKPRVRRARASTLPGGGRVNFTFTEESKAKISASLKAVRQLLSIRPPLTIPPLLPCCCLVSLPAHPEVGGSTLRSAALARPRVPRRTHAAERLGGDASSDL